MKPTKILIAGDLFPVPCNYDLFTAGDTQALFGERLCALFASADVRVCNLEGCFTDSNDPIEKIGPAIKAPASTIKAIKIASCAPNKAASMMNSRSFRRFMRAAKRTTRWSRATRRQELRLKSNSERIAPAGRRSFSHCSAAPIRWIWSNARRSPRRNI